ncbi:NAD(P)-binding protein [Punctularia strigosozonata HHB-11173 SS5]|uniref:NAD(P)-binding protein n=1 Tax=Punctularia strigosozonata (strain HHB-11173) TaxID=741275 RepID=UPI0004416F06|nr:NAD(P)-binding protein [Punctularia strigosozonata HHB-11173 SS5]EIN11815.1 NAD(P)-binding protein [Punctularia strigosozonata HHB-11173 SS5]
MRAFIIDHYEHPSKLQINANAPEPKPGPSEVVVDVYSAGLNFFDILQAQGKYQHQPPFPFVLGHEFAGRIAKDSPIPKGCPFRPGDRVFGAAQGCYAEKVTVPVPNLVPLPDNMSYDQGAGLFVTWPTSYEALVGRAELKPGEWVLVTASAGGVGIAACQLAKALGAKVIAAAGSPAKLEVSRRHGGADYTVDYTKKDWQKEVLKITGGKGVDVIYDPVGMIKDCLKCIAWKGRALVIGFAAGKIEQLPLNLVLLKNISIVGLHWGAYSRNETSRPPVVWKELLDLFQSGKCSPVVYDKVYPLEDLVSGLNDLEQRRTWGKAIARVRPDDRNVNKAKL